MAISKDIGKFVTVDEGHRKIKTLVVSTRKSTKKREGVVGRTMYLVRPLPPHEHIAPFWIFKPGQSPFGL